MPYDTKQSYKICIKTAQEVIRSGVIITRSSIRQYYIKHTLNSRVFSRTLQWRNNGRDCASIHRRLDCLLNRLSRRRAKKSSKLRVTGSCEANFPQKGPVPRNFFPFHDVVMKIGRVIITPHTLYVNTYISLLLFIIHIIWCSLHL